MKRRRGDVAFCPASCACAVAVAHAFALWNHGRQREPVHPSAFSTTTASWHRDGPQKRVADPLDMTSGR